MAGGRGGGEVEKYIWEKHIFCLIKYDHILEQTALRLQVC